MNECENFWTFRLKLLRILLKLGLSFRKGLNIAYSFRNKLTFGLVWWHQISETTKNRLCQLWRIAIRAIARIHPSSPIDNFMSAMSIPALEDFTVYLLTQRKFDGKFLMKNIEEVEQRPSHSYRLRPRKSAPDQVHWLHRRSNELLIWLNQRVASFPKRSPKEMLRRKMFGMRPHPDTDISELVRLANGMNSFYMSTLQNTDRPPPPL